MAQNVEVAAQAVVENNENAAPVDLVELDAVFDDQKYELVYQRLLDARNAAESADVLWRLARVLYMKAGEPGLAHSQEKELLAQAQQLADRGHQLAPKDFECLRWAAIVTGALSDRGRLGNKEKIQMGNQFKEYLEKALELEPEDHVLAHLFGRLHFSVANLSWVERNLATVLYGKPPEGTMDDALQMFLKAEQVKPSEWIENLLYLAKTLHAKGNKTDMVRYLRVADSIEPINLLEQNALKEVKHLLKKHAK